jgi:hypothetical protein
VQKLEQAVQEEAKNAKAETDPPEADSNKADDTKAKSWLRKGLIVKIKSYEADPECEGLKGEVIDAEKL